MSLVAYGDSDDGSSDSETEETSLQAKTSPTATTTKAIQNVQNISNSEAPIDIKPSSQTEKRSRLSALLPKPQNKSQDTVVIHTEPQKKLLDLKALQDEDDDEIIDVEEEYVPLKEIKKNTKKTAVEKGEEQKSVGSLFSRMPSPWSLATGISLPKKRGASDEIEASSTKKGKHPVKIVAPTLVDADSDEESDEKKIASKTVKQAKSGSGLSSLLPKPKYSVTLTASNPNKPTVKLSNRALIPHTLTKKPTSKETKTTKKIEDRRNSDEDEDKEPVSFFTFNDKNDVATKSVTKSSIATKPTETTSFSSNIKVVSVPEVVGAEPNPFGYEESRDVSEEVGNQSSYNYYGNTGDANQYSDTTTTYYQPQDGSQPHEYGSYDQSTYTAYYDTQPSYSQYHQPDEPQDIDIDKMHRLQGRKNRNEQINIIDINAADQTADTKVQLTNLTAEQFAHKSSKKSGNMPSSQQRRKHQITYLAFQAKEREFELQQQWASNRQTKRQTQAKYGF